MQQIACQEGFLKLLDAHRGILYKVANAYCTRREERRRFGPGRHCRALARLSAFSACTRRLLHFILVAQIIAAVVHRVRLLQIGPARPLDLHSQLLALSKIAQWRVKLARISLIALPVALLALLQVLAKAFCEIDLYGAVGPWLALAVGLSTSLSCGWLALQLRRDRDFAPRTLDLLSLGALARMDALVQALEASAVSREAE